MALEITYGGGVMETYPAQFGNIQKVTVISEPSSIPPANKGTLMNELAYEISSGNSIIHSISSVGIILKQ